MSMRNKVMMVSFFPGSRGRPRQVQYGVHHASTSRNIEDDQTQSSAQTNGWNKIIGSSNMPKQSSNMDDDQTQNLPRWTNQQSPNVEDDQTQSNKAQNTKKVPYVWETQDGNHNTPLQSHYYENSYQYMPNNTSPYALSNNTIHNYPSTSNNTPVWEYQNNRNNGLSNNNNIPVWENTRQTECSYSHNDSTDSNNLNNNQIQHQEVNFALQPCTTNNNSTVSAQPIPHVGYNTIAWDLANKNPNVAETLQQAFPRPQGGNFQAPPAPRRKEMQTNSRTMTRTDSSINAFRSEGAPAILSKSRKEQRENTTSPWNRNAPTYSYRDELRHRQATKAPKFAVQGPPKRRPPLLPTPRLKQIAMQEAPKRRPALLPNPGSGQFAMQEAPKRRPPLLPTPDFEQSRKQQTDEVRQNVGLNTHHSRRDAYGSRQSFQPPPRVKNNLQQTPTYTQQSLPQHFRNNNNYASRQQKAITMNKKKNEVRENLNKLLEHVLPSNEECAVSLYLDHLQNCGKTSNNEFCSICDDILSTYHHAKICYDRTCDQQLCRALNKLFAKEKGGNENNIDTIEIPECDNLSFDISEHMKYYF